MIITLSEEQVNAMMETIAAAYSEGQGGDYEFFLDAVEKYYPKIREKYNYIRK